MKEFEIKSFWISETSDNQQFFLLQIWFSGKTESHEGPNLASEADLIATKVQCDLVNEETDNHSFFFLFGESFVFNCMALSKASKWNENSDEISSHLFLISKFSVKITFII